jgi:hypothetical protein
MTNESWIAKMDNTQLDAKKLLSLAMEEKDIDALLAKLSAKEKQELLQKLLGQQQSSGLMVVAGGSNVTTSDVVIQIHANADIDISDIIRAVANKITPPESPKQQTEENNNS